MKDKRKIDDKNNDMDRTQYHHDQLQRENQAVAMSG